MTQPYVEVADVLLQRMRRMGLTVPDTVVPPALPDGWWFGKIVQSTSDHCCERDRAVEIPLALIVDIEVESDDGDPDKGPLIIRAKERFRPYWILGIRLIHDWVPYPEEQHRDVTAIEAACVFAQNPRLGSVKGHLGRHWGHGSIQAFACPERKRVVLSTYGLIAYNHHATFCRTTLAFDGGHSYEAKYRDTA